MKQIMRYFSIILMLDFGISNDIHAAELIKIKIHIHFSIVDYSLTLIEINSQKLFET